jgi:ribosomal protein S12 methylthiotransferase accessory factor
VVPGLLAGDRTVTATSRPSFLGVVDSRVGIVRSCTRLAKDRREPARPIIYQATLSNFDFRRAPHERVTTGKGLTDDAARVGAVVEALERYCALQPRPGALTVGRADALDAPAIAPHEFVLYSDRQYERQGFPYRKPAGDEELTWVRAIPFESDHPVYAPASLVYLGFVGAGGREFFTPSTSSGLAGGADLTSAVLAGLYELVERDAFVLTWLNRLPAPRIDFSPAEEVAHEVRRHYKRFEIETLAFDLTTDLQIPVVMALILDRTGNLPAATVGLGCHIDPSIALERAMMEAVQVRTGTAPWFHIARRPASINRYEDVRTIEDHAVFAAAPEHLHEFDFILEGSRSRALADMAGHDSNGVDTDLDFCRKQLTAAGCTVAFVDLTQPELEPFDVRIVRAIATGLQPIHFGFGEERLGGRRLFSVARLLGHEEAREMSEDALNRCPHPLA